MKQPKSNFASIVDLHEKLVGEYSKGGKIPKAKLVLPKSFKSRASHETLISQDTIDLVLANKDGSNRKQVDTYRGSTEAGPLTNCSP